MKILLISSGRGRENTLGNAALENLALGYLVAWLKVLGHLVKVIDLSFDPKSDADLVELCQNDLFDMVGISSMTWCMREACATARALKAAIPGLTLVAGGAGPTAWPEFYQDSFDHVVVGEGEPGLAEVLKRGRASSGITKVGRDLAWSGRPWPWHDRSLCERGKLHMRGTWPMERSKQWPVSISGSRGCPNACSFCLSEAMWGRRVVFRPVADVVDEIEFLANEGYNSVDFCDLNLNLRPSWLLELCSEIIKRGLNRRVVMGGLWNPAVTHRINEVIPACAEAGFVMLSVGLENPNPTMRQSMEKQTTPTDRMHEVLERMADATITSRLLFIVGSPNQDEANISELMAFATSSRASELRISIHTPFPGTHDWQNPEIQKLIITHDWRLYDTAHQVMASPMGDVERVRMDVLRSFYNSPRYRENRTALCAKNPGFVIGYRQLEGGFLATNNLIEPANRLP